jgi:hypothetical protein
MHMQHYASAPVHCSNEGSAQLKARSHRPLPVLVLADTACHEAGEHEHCVDVAALGRVPVGYGGEQDADEDGCHKLGGVVEKLERQAGEIVRRDGEPCRVEEDPPMSCVWLWGLDRCLRRGVAY